MNISVPVRFNMWLSVVPSVCALVSVNPSAFMNAVRPFGNTLLFNARSALSLALFIAASIFPLTRCIGQVDLRNFQLRIFPVRNSWW